MKDHVRPSARHWMVVGVLVLIAGHGVIFYYLSSRMALSATVLSGVIVLLVVKHLGFFAPLYALLRRRFRNRS